MRGEGVLLGLGARCQEEGKESPENKCFFNIQAKIFKNNIGVY